MCHCIRVDLIFRSNDRGKISTGKWYETNGSGKDNEKTSVCASVNFFNKSKICANYLSGV